MVFLMLSNLINLKSELQSFDNLREHRYMKKIGFIFVNKNAGFLLLLGLFWGLFINDVILINENIVTGACFFIFVVRMSGLKDWKIKDLIQGVETQDSFQKSQKS